MKNFQKKWDQPQGILSQTTLPRDPEMEADLKEIDKLQKSTQKSIDTDIEEVAEHIRTDDEIEDQLAENLKQEQIDDEAAGQHG